MERSTALWSLVAFFGAWLAFNAMTDLTAGESTAVRLLAQLAVLAVIVAFIVFLVRRSERGDRKP